MTDARVVIAGEELDLCPERAAYWARRRILLVADPHFGKAASFRALGVHVPEGTTNSNFARLDQLIARLGPARLVFLGDFLHAKEGRSDRSFDALAAWRARHASIEMQIVRGNHDWRAGDPPAHVGIACVDGPLAEPPFAFVHHPAAVNELYALAGHVHPCATIMGPARQYERLACFWFRGEIGVLPAFGEFTGCGEVDRGEGDEVWLVADDEVCKTVSAR